jgi:hypothetical protein
MSDASDLVHYTPFTILVCVATPNSLPKRPCTFSDEVATRLTDLVTVLFGEDILDYNVSVTVLGQIYNATQTVAEQIPDRVGRVAMRTAEALTVLGPLPTVLPLMYRTYQHHLPAPLPLTTEAQEDEEMTALQISALSGALIGSAQRLDAFLWDSQDRGIWTPYGRSRPLRELAAFLGPYFDLPADHLLLVGPVQFAEVPELIRNTGLLFRREGALAVARQ